MDTPLSPFTHTHPVTTRDVRFPDTPPAALHLPRWVMDDVSDDERVLKLLAEGDRRGAVALLMSLHGEAVYLYCLRILRDRSLADDVLQQVFVEAFRDLGRFEGRSTLRSWLLGIAGHRCLDALKARHRSERRIEKSDTGAVALISDQSPNPLERLEQARRILALEDCMSRLSDKIRDTLLLRFKSGRSYEEMSDILGEKAATLQARVARALPALRRCLEENGVSL